MAAQKWFNNFNYQFATVVATGDTILHLPSGATAVLGTLTAGDWIIMTAYRMTGSVESNVEIVKVTNVDPNGGGDCLLTVVRAQEGTTAKAYLTTDYISIRVTAGGVNGLVSDAELAAHASSTSNPHTVTKSQVGLGSVDNTSDAGKPVSTAQQTALDLKINTSAKDATGGVPGLTLFKLNLRNAGNSITNFFQIITNTVERTWTMPDKDGTVAMTSDITDGTSAGSFTNIKTSGTMGYGSGAGGTVTQATSKSTSVTLNKPCGQITMHNAALAAGASVIVTLLNSVATIADLCNATGNNTVNANNYRIEVSRIATGQIDFRVTNISAGSLSESLQINFAIIKGVTS